MRRTIHTAGMCLIREGGLESGSVYRSALVESSNPPGDVSGFFLKARIFGVFIAVMSWNRFSASFFLYSSWSISKSRNKTNIGQEAFTNFKTSKVLREEITLVKDRPQSLPSWKMNSLCAENQL
jgi:hypothetical protein